MPTYRVGKKGMYILLSNSCLVLPAVVMQQQEEISRNHIPSLFATSVSDIDVLGHGSRKIRFYKTVPKVEHPVAHFQASILQAKAGRRRWLPVGGGGGGGDVACTALRTSSSSSSNRPERKTSCETFGTVLKNLIFLLPWPRTSISAFDTTSF